MSYQKYCRMSQKPTSLGAWLTSKMWRDFVTITGEICSPVLEIGPGRGHVARWCRDNNIIYTGIEASKQEAYKLNKEGYDIYISNVPPIPARIACTSTFNTCIMLNVLEHMRDHVGALKLLEELHEVLKGRGTILITVPQYDGYNFWRNTFDHSYPCTRERMKGLLAAAGFTRVTAEFHSFVFHGITAWLWSRIGKVLPTEVLASIWPENIWCRRIQKFGSFFALRIWVTGHKD